MPLSPLRCFAVLLSLVPSVFFAGATMAQDPVAPGPPPGMSVSTAEAADPPGRVGRLSDLNGQVWLYHPGGGEWISAERNRPLTTGDRLATDAGARAEVRIGSTTLRLDAGSELEVLRLDDDRMAFQLHNGSVAARLRSRESVPEFELTTGEGRFTAQRTGRYRFDRSDDTSFVTVYSGQATYEGPGSALKVDNGQRAEFWIDQANAAQYRLAAPVSDAFAGWNNERDRGDDRSASATRVSPEMTGVEDLDRYGRWEDTPEYGSVWYPRAVAPGWAPYSTGRWAWVQPWGWTWVDDAPWGFAPFHYGRWVYVRNNWCWSPGQYVRRPVYAPALVAWVGGPRLSVSVNIGGGPAVGWVPLAPREVFVPSYRVTPRYVREVNVTQVTNITNINTIVTNPQAAVGQRDFSNRKFPHAVTVVPASVLSSRQPVGPAASQWRNSPVVRQLADEPSRVSAVVAPQVSMPVAQPQPPRGQGFPLPPGRWRDANSRAEEPRAPSRAVQAAPAAPMPMTNPMAPQPGMAPAPTMPGGVAGPGRDRQEPPPRMRIQPMPGGGDGRRDGPPTPMQPSIPPLVQAPVQAPVQPQRPMPIPQSRAQPAVPPAASPEITHADRARAAIAAAEARRQSAAPPPLAAPPIQRAAPPAAAPPAQPPAAVRQMERLRPPEMARPEMPRPDRDGRDGRGGREGSERQEGPRGDRPQRGPGSN